jgi:hypothetical protein
LKLGLSSIALLLASGILLDQAVARGATSEAFPGTLAFHEGKLTAKLNAVPLKQVMQEIGDLSGAEIVWLQQDGAGTVSVDFSNVPFTRALRLILGEKNFLLFYSLADDEAHLSQIWISSGGGGGNQATPSTPVNVTLLRQWYQTALRGARLVPRLQAVARLKQQASTHELARRFLTHLARRADNLQVQRAAAAAAAQTQARK